VTVALAFLALGERLTPAQLVGGAMVLSAVVLLQLRPRPVRLRLATAAAASANAGH
jgi:drug/metabolite transporter (DMT)-like permease